MMAPSIVSRPSRLQIRLFAAASLEETHGPTRSILMVANAFLTAVIFAFDVLSPLGIAVAALYIVVLLISLRFADLKGVVLIASGCIGLTIVGYLVGHAHDTEEGPLLRCAISVLAISIATILCVQIRLATSRLRSSEERYRSIFQNTGVAIWEQDYRGAAENCAPFLPQGLQRLREHLLENESFLKECLLRLKTIDANIAARYLIGNLAREAPLESWEAADLTEVLPTFREILLAYLANEGSCTVQTTVRATDGSQRDLIVTATFLADRSKSVLISALDVTAQIAAEKALQQSVAELTRVSRIATLGTLTASIGHEINQPLAAVITNGEAALRWLKHETPDFDEVKTCIAEAVNEGRRAAAIIQRLRSLAVKGELSRSQTDLNGIVTQVMAMAKRELSDHEISTTLDLAADLPSIAADAIQLQQVTMNLVNNAMHAMRESRVKELRVETSIGEHSARVAVRDTGTGVDESQAKRLFVPFVTTKSEGMGIGLSISRSIIESHRGRIWMEPNKGAGTTFFFSIPTGSANLP